MGLQEELDKQRELKKARSINQIQPDRQRSDSFEEAIEHDRGLYWPEKTYKSENKGSSGFYKFAKGFLKTAVVLLAIGSLSLIGANKYKDLQMSGKVGVDVIGRVIEEKYTPQKKTKGRRGGEEIAEESKYNLSVRAFEMEGNPTYSIKVNDPPFRSKIKETTNEEIDQEDTIKFTIIDWKGVNCFDKNNVGENYANDIELVKKAENDKKSK